MNRDEIVSALFTGTNFNRALAKMEPDYLRDDLRMEVFAVVCEWDSSFVEGLYERKQLDFYVIRVMMNQIQSNTSPFFKKYRRPVTEIQEAWALEADVSKKYNQGVITKQIVGLSNPDFLSEAEEMESRVLAEDFETAILGDLEGLHWYYSAMVKLYLDCGSFMKMQQITGIPKPSCYKTVKAAFKQLKRHGQPSSSVFKINAKEEDSFGQVAAG
jgi:hypothetical protein